jgi:hypothetical protein
LTPSVYYAESEVECTLAKAWEILLDYPAWNPTFAGAQVSTVKGAPRTEGEVVLIRKPLLDVKGEPIPEFYAETVKLAPQRHIVWYVYPKAGEDFRNFVDFGLAETAHGVRFNIYYYEQNLLSGELLEKQRRDYAAALQHTANTFKAYCESRPACA